VFTRRDDLIPLEERRRRRGVKNRRVLSSICIWVIDEGWMMDWYGSDCPQVPFLRLVAGNCKKSCMICITIHHRLVRCLQADQVENQEPQCRLIAHTTMSLTSLLSQPCSSRFASSLLTSLQRSNQSRAFVSTPRARNDKDAQPQTPASEAIELSSVSLSNYQR
jgi:hypothetical protein